ncbi:MAG TPA: GNAT family N-acetyltransferase [Opitutus sp.]|nr:GNAT family N-acetyltransferase [Opitutus sp.]
MLRTGEAVSAAVVGAPDNDWAARIERMLVHTGDPWNWQNSELLRRDCGVAANFFVLQREGAPFANIMLVETAGVALLGHVWTAPADRGGGASSILMERAMDDFATRGGRAIFLGTEFDSTAWRYYQRRGFEPVEPGSGYMEFHRQPRAEFERGWFGAKETIIEPLDWPHWPAAAPLCLGDFGDVVRLAAVRLIGRRSSEEPLLTLIREARRQHAAGAPPPAFVLRDANGPAVLGVACRQPHPLWPGTEILDVFCHPRWWRRGADLIAALPRAGASRTIAYADANQTEKRAAFEGAGLRETTVLPRWVRRAAAGSERVDVSVFASD